MSISEKKENSLDAVERRKAPWPEKEKEYKTALFKQQERFKMLHKMLRSGMWSFFTDAEDNVVRMQFSDEAMRIVGYEPDEFPKGNAAFTEKIHPEDRERSVNSMRRFIRDHSENSEYNEEYRMMDAHGVYHWFHCVGRIIRDDDGNGEIFGTFVDCTSEHENASYQEQLRRNYDMIRVLASGYSSVYYINLDTEEIIPYSMNANTEQEFGNIVHKGTKYTDAFGAYVDIAVFDTDKAMMLETASVENIKKILSEKNDFSTVFRMNYYGKPKFSEMKFVKVNPQEKIPSSVIIAFAVKDEEIVRRYVDDRLHGEFASIFLVDLDTDSFRFVYRSDDSGFVDVPEGIYSETIKEYSERVTSEYTEEWEEMSHPDRVREILMNVDRKEYVYMLGGVEKTWRRCVMKVVGRRAGVPTMFIMTYLTIDEDRVERIKLSTQVEKQKQELEIQQKALENALAMAQSASRAKTTFLNNMSHDIRTPMNAIIGYTGLAASHIDSKEMVRDYLSKISQASDHLLSLINDVLDMSRIESGKMNIEEKEENLSVIIHTIRDIVQSDILAKNLDFLIDTVDVNDEYVICDKLRLKQVLLNVISNAIKYTHFGGMVSLRIAEKTVTHSGYGSYEFRIKDNGIGMSEEFLKTIFDPFTRVKSSTVSGIQGTGLGMAITKSIVDMMGGEIRIFSKENEGTEVVISFEFKLVEASVNAFEKIPAFQGMRSLVVDDDMNACSSISKMLRDVGLRPEWCISGKEAIFRTEDALRGGDLFKLYIIDWLMPDINGIETARRIRKIVGDRAPIIILTAYDWSDIENEAREAGVTEFLSKPMFPSDLHRVLLKCAGLGEESRNDDEEYSFEGKKALLVEDNLLNLEIATEILTESGFEITQAEDGNIALEKMRNASADDYDIIFMDIQMPTMDGYEATRQIRALGGFCEKIPIIAMTANAFSEDKKAAIDAGMNDHISKPIDVAKLKETIAHFLN